MTPIENTFERIEIFTADGVFLKQSVFPKSGMVIPQHAHVFDHTTMVACGSVDVYRDSEPPIRLEAPTGILIKKGIKHTFVTLESNTVVWCIHNGLHPEVAKVLEEHELEF